MANAKKETPLYLVEATIEDMARELSKRGLNFALCVEENFRTGKHQQHWYYFVKSRPQAALKLLEQASRGIADFINKLAKN